MGFAQRRVGFAHHYRRAGKRRLRSPPYKRYRTLPLVFTQIFSQNKFTVPQQGASIPREYRYPAPRLLEFANLPPPCILSIIIQLSLIKGNRKNNLITREAQLGTGDTIAECKYHLFRRRNCLKLAIYFKIKK